MGQKYHKMNIICAFDVTLIRKNAPYSIDCAFLDIHTLWLKISPTVIVYLVIVFHNDVLAERALSFGMFTGYLSSSSITEKL